MSGDDPYSEERLARIADYVAKMHTHFADERRERRRAVRALRRMLRARLRRGRASDRAIDSVLSSGFQAADPTDTDKALLEALRPRLSRLRRVFGHDSSFRGPRRGDRGGERDEGCQDEVT